MNRHKTPCYRWLSFRLRTLFVLTAAFGIVCLICVNLKWISDRHAMLLWLDEQSNSPGWPMQCNYRHHFERANSHEAQLPSFLRLIGERGVLYIGVPDNGSANLRLSEIQRLFPEAHVEIDHSKVPDLPSWMRED